MQLHRSISVAVLVATLLTALSCGAPSASALRSAADDETVTKSPISHKHQNNNKPHHGGGGKNNKHWKPPHVKDWDTEIFIRACNSQPHAPGPREQPVCHGSGDADELVALPVTENVTDAPSPPGCQTLKVVPGQCNLGYSISCFYFPHCINSDFYPMSSSCTGRHVNQNLGPCDNTFTPVIPGCTYYKCNDTAFQKHKCIPKQLPAEKLEGGSTLDLDTSPQSHNFNPSTVDALRIIANSQEEERRQDKPYTPRGGAAIDDAAERKVDGEVTPSDKKTGFFRGLERNCTHNVKCFEDQPMDFGKCLPIGGSSSVLNHKLTGEMKPGQPFKNCGWVVVSKWRDQKCRGMPESEFASHTNECKFGMDPFKPGQYASLMINCAKKHH